MCRGVENVIKCFGATNRLTRNGFDPQYDAHPLRREIQRRLENKHATALLSGQFPKGSTIKAYLKGDEIAFQKVGKTTKRSAPVTA